MPTIDVQQRTHRFVLLSCKNSEVNFLVSVAVEPVNKSYAESASATSKNHMIFAWKSTHDLFNKTVSRHLVSYFFLLIFLLFAGILGTWTKEHCTRIMRGCSENTIYSIVCSWKEQLNTIFPSLARPNYWNSKRQ